MYVSSGTASLVNCSFVGNTVSSSGELAWWKLVIRHRADSV
jgi:hypothetical protein